MDEWQQYSADLNAWLRAERAKMAEAIAANPGPVTEDPSGTNDLLHMDEALVKRLLFVAYRRPDATAERTLA